MFLLLISFYYSLCQDQLSTSNQAREFKRSQSNNDDDPNSSFMDYDEDDEYDDNSENLNYLDLINNRNSFDDLAQQHIFFIRGSWPKELEEVIDQRIGSVNHSC